MKSANFQDPVFNLNLDIRLDYTVIFTKNVFSTANPTLKDLIRGGGSNEEPRLICIVDNSLAKNRPTLVQEIQDYFLTDDGDFSLVESPSVLKGGEAAKESMKTVDYMLTEINRYGLDRHSYVIVVGGGALIDAVGFATAIAHRGIRLIRIPSTVLAQNDAAIGVKNGINYFGKKNFLGTFTVPFGVINDISLLTTLEYRDWISGVAEAVKVALLKDTIFFEYIEKEIRRIKDRDIKVMERVIIECAKLHLDHISRSGDPFEQGSSRPLDFGHWAAHKLEQLSEYQLRHGEAVAVGICLDSTYSRLMGFLSEYEWKKVLSLFIGLGFNINVSELDQRNAKGNRAVLAGLEEFRQHLGGEMTIMLLKGIGVPYEVNLVDYKIMDSSIDLLMSITNGEHLKNIW